MAQSMSSRGPSWSPGGLPPSRVAMPRCMAIPGLPCLAAACTASRVVTVDTQTLDRSPSPSSATALCHCRPFAHAPPVELKLMKHGSSHARLRVQSRVRALYHRELSRKSRLLHRKRSVLAQ